MYLDPPLTPLSPCAGAVLPGYFQGKRRAEEALALRYPRGGVALRPGFIYGTRNVSGVGIPLGAIGARPARCSAVRGAGQQVPGSSHALCGGTWCGCVLAGSLMR